MAAVHDEAVASVSRKKHADARPESRTELCSVHRATAVATAGPGSPSWFRGAHRSRPKKQHQRWLGTFRTAEEAARAYDAAAVTLRGAATMTTNFKDPAAPVTKRESVPKKRPRSGFVGVYRTRYGKYCAQIRDPERRLWLGAAARAYGTNFVQRAAADADDAPLRHVSCEDKKRKKRDVARSGFRGVYSAQIQDPGRRAKLLCPERVLTAEEATSFNQPPTAGAAARQLRRS